MRAASAMRACSSSADSEPRRLRAHEPEHDDAVVGHVAQRLERARSLVVVLEQEAVEARAAEHLLARCGRSRPTRRTCSCGCRGRCGCRTSSPRVARDDRVVELDAGVEHLVRIAAALPVALADRLVEQRRVLRRVDLDVLAAEPAQLRDLAPREVHEVGQVGVARRVGAARLVRVVVGGRLLRADAA